MPRVSQSYRPGLLVCDGSQNFRRGYRCHYNRGCFALASAQHAVVADRIEASYAIAVAMTGSDLCLKQMVPAHLESLFDVMQQAGVNIKAGTDEVRVSSTGQYRGIDIQTQLTLDFRRICKHSLWR